VDANHGAVEIRARIADVVESRVPDSAPDISALLALLGASPNDFTWDAVDPTERRRRTIDAVKRLLGFESRIQPLVVVFEDVHWIDADSRAVLEALVEEAPSRSMLLIMTCRENPELRWAVENGHVDLVIGPLPPNTATELLDSLVGGDDALATLKERLIAWTEGNPFFLEESVQALVETGALVGEPGDRRLVTPIPEIALPPTVQEILGDRIDRLTLEDRQLLQSAAVIGSHVPRAVLAAISNVPGERFDEQLQRLAGAEMLYEGVASDELVFKHPLTHEVAYQGLLPEQRRALHARVLAVLETAGGDSVDRLAYHAFRGGVWAKAVVHARRAGERALRASASHEAEQYFEQALRALAHLPEDRINREQAIDVRLGLRDVLWALARLPEIHDHLREAQRLADLLDDRRRASAIACYSCQYFWSIGDHRNAIEGGERALRTADELRSPALAAEARFYLALAYLATGEARRAAGLLATNLATLDAVVATHAGEFASRRFAATGPILVRGWMARVLAELGQFADAEACGRDGLTAADNVDHPFAFAAASVGLGFVSLRKAEPAAAIGSLERALALCRTYDLGNWIATVAACLGALYVDEGRVEEGVALLEEAVQQHTRTGIMASHSLWLVMLAAAYLVAGRADDATTTARAALERSRASGTHGDEGWASFTLGEIAAARGEPGAQTAYEEALAVAQKLEMRPLEARCHLALGRLLARSGERASAQRHLDRAAALARDLGMRLDAARPAAR
jgi:tetratricopeptide (TPR) repeat protein